VQGKEFFKRLHDEKIKFSSLTNSYNRAINDFESIMNAKNKTISEIKAELGSTINKMAETETKMKDIQINLKQKNGY
jgi:hypothetical protein